MALAECLIRTWCHLSLWAFLANKLGEAWPHLPLTSFSVLGKRGKGEGSGAGEGAPTCPRFSRFMAKCALGVSVAHSQSKSESDSDGDLFMWLAGCCCSRKRRGQLHDSKCCSPPFRAFFGSPKRLQSALMQGKKKSRKSF